MRKKSKDIERIILRVEPTQDGYWVIKKYGDGNGVTTYPFRYGQQHAAEADMNLIVKGLLMKGFTASVEAIQEDTAE